MCLATPARVLALLPDHQARVDIGGASRIVSLELVDAVAEGDHVLVHVGYALARLDAAEAQRTLDLIDAVQVSA
ncbi:HypC/HybG/HupF family hydrogenase formation chaperone [Pararhodospirillum photometricum]|nr:HypC/HybG/HupF family hydrogenase formation chaperone [Pararhodospirillum photometricum]